MAACVYGLFSLWIIFRSLDMPLTAIDEIGYGFYPLILGISMFLISIWWLISVIKEKNDEKKELKLNKEGKIKLLALVGSLFFTFLLMAYFGYFISFIVFYLFIVFVIEKKRGKTALLSIGYFSIIIISVYVIFNVWFDVPLPVSIF